MDVTQTIPHTPNVGHSDVDRASGAARGGHGSSREFGDLLDTLVQRVTNVHQGIGSAAGAVAPAAETRPPAGARPTS